MMPLAPVSDQDGMWSDDADCSPHGSWDSWSEKPGAGSGEHHGVMGGMVLHQ